MLNRFILLILAISMASTLSAQEKISKSFRGIKEIKLSTGSGDCHIVKGKSPDILVDLTYTYDEENYIPVLEQDGDVLILKDKFKNNRSGTGDSKWQLSVPDNINLKYSSGSGNLDISGVNLELTSNSGSGDVEARDMSGQITSNSGSGEVNIDGFKGQLKINTGSGDVELGNASGDLKINLGSGNIKAENITGGVKFNAGSGNISVNEAVITEVSAMNSGSGDAKLVLKSDLKADISLNSGSGDATLDFNGLEVKGHFTMKANKKRGTITAPFEFDEVTEDGQGNQTVVTKKAKVGSSTIKINIGTGSGRASVKK